jgi:hypothetical protein
LHILLIIDIFPKYDKQILTLLLITIMSYGVFREIKRLIEYIPIEIDTYGIGKLATNTFIDSRYHFKDIDRIATRLGILEIGRNTVSLRYHKTFK